MNLTFGKAWLEDLAFNPDARTKLSRAIVRAYRERISQIIDAADERDLRAIKDAHFEKLRLNWLASIQCACGAAGASFLK